MIDDVENKPAKEVNASSFVLSNSLIRSLSIGLAYGLIAGLINAFFHFQIYGNLTFHLGQTLVILCILVHGFKSGLVAATISIGILSYALSNPFFFPTLILETVALYWFNKRGTSILLGDILYWLFIGIPITWIVLIYTTTMPLEYQSLVNSKQLLNGLLYTLLASIIYMSLPYHWKAHKYKTNLPKMSSKIFYLLNLSIVLPALIVALVFTSRMTDEYENQVEKLLVSTSSLVSESVDTHLNMHLNVTKNLSIMILSAKKPEEVITETQLSFPGFITMLIADESGKVTAGAPIDFYKNIASAPEAQRNVSDRGYFSVPRATKRPYLSNAFLGRGFGNDPIVAISSPILVNGEFAGIVEGSLNLPKFEVIEELVQLEKSEFHIVVTDKENKIVYSSKELPLKTLDSFNPLPEENNRYIDGLSLMLLDGVEYLYYLQSNSYEWNIYTLKQPKLISNFIIENLLILTVTLILISGFFLLVSHRFANQITYPLISLTRIFNRGESYSLDNSLYNTVEVRNIAEQLENAKQILNGFNQKLEKQVEAKTLELSELNDKLLKLSLEDELTQLPNRRSFDEKASHAISINARQKQITTLAAIDIDFFKKINDEFGHAFGDECLIAVAHTIRKHFNRAADIVCRYGGEEFIILLSGDNCTSHLAQLELFRKAVSNLTFFEGGQPVKITVSIGAACVETNFSQSYSDVMKVADNLLYKSKNSGRNCTSHQKI